MLLGSQVSEWSWSITSATHESRIGFHQVEIVEGLSILYVQSLFGLTALYFQA
jgi:hypothetical protein